MNVPLNLKCRCLTALAVFVVMLAVAAQCGAQAPVPVLSWHFDETSGDTAAEQMHHADGKLFGVYSHMNGITGSALRLDGESSGARVPSAAVPALSSGFTVEAWIAIDAYPWNWAPIVDQRKDGEDERNETSGFFFGVDSLGHLGLQAEIGGEWEELTSAQQLPLKKWVHVAASFSADSGMALFIDGKPMETLKTQGGYSTAWGADLLIGRARYPMLPAHWIHPKFEVKYSFDGVLDELNIFDKALSAEQIAAEYGRVQIPPDDPLHFPKLPSGPPGAGTFGAYYASLKYDELWDAPRRIGRDSDVVVRFDDSPVRFVSWQGTSFIPAWVTENGIWYTDEFVEAWGNGKCSGGEDCEPMSDKQNRFAHVRILENTPARVVIHFRYGQCEVENSECASPDPFTGWTDSADDYYTVYPDEVGARKSVAWSSNLKEPPEFQETIIINPPGKRPEEDIENDALTFANMKGETHTYSWLHPPKAITMPVGANIQNVNLKSQWKPFQIVMPDHPHIDVYGGEKTYSLFEWYNHWPISQVKSSGISAVAPDRASHSSLSHIEGQPYQRTADSMTKIMLVGLTNKPTAELAVLARSWATPPEMEVAGSGYSGNGYDPTQRAFVVKRSTIDTTPLRLSFKATADSPLFNPALVVEGWGESVPALTVNGKHVAWGKDARYGLVGNLDHSTLVVWLRMEAEAETSIEIR
jgi:hypothetical protein